MHQPVLANWLYRGPNSQWLSMIIYLLIDSHQLLFQTIDLLIHSSNCGSVHRLINWWFVFLVVTEAIAWDHLRLSGCLSNSLNNLLSKNSMICSNNWTKVVIHPYICRCRFLSHWYVGCFVALVKKFELLRTCCCQLCYMR